MCFDHDSIIGKKLGRAKRARCNLCFQIKSACTAFSAHCKQPGRHCLLLVTHFYFSFTRFTPTKSDLLSQFCYSAVVMSVTRKSQVSRSCSKQEWKPQCVWVGVRRSEVCCSAVHWSHTFKRKGKKKNSRNCKQSQSGLNWGGVSQGLEWAGDYHLFKPEKKSISEDWAECTLALTLKDYDEWCRNEFSAWRARVWFQLHFWVQPRCPEGRGERCVLICYSDIVNLWSRL